MLLGYTECSTKEKTERRTEDAIVSACDTIVRDNNLILIVAHETLGIIVFNKGLWLGLDHIFASNLLCIIYDAVSIVCTTHICIHINKPCCIIEPTHSFAPRKLTIP